MGELQISTTVLSWHSDAPGDSWLNFFLGLSPKGTWIPGGMKCNPISPSYPPSCFAVNLLQIPSACPGRDAAPLQSQSLLVSRQFSPCVLAEELGSCPVKSCLVVTSLFLQFSPEDAPNQSVHPVVVTLVLKTSRVLAQGAYVKPAPDSTRK